MASDIDLVFGVATGGGADEDSADLILRQLTQIVDEINRTPFKIKFEVDPSTEESFKKLQEQITGIKQGSESIAQSMSASFTDIAASMSKLFDSIKSISSRRGSGAPVLFVKEEIQEEKERVREYIDMVRDMRSDLLQTINQDAGKGGDAKFMSAFGIDALQEVQKELWKSFDSSSDVFKALEDRLEKSTISTTINKIFGEAKAQFEAFAPYVEKAASIGIMDTSKYASLFGKESDHAAVSGAIKEEAESVEKLNDEYDKHKSSVEQAAHAESTKASDSAKLSSSLVEESGALNKTSQSADETTKAYDSLIGLIDEYGKHSSKLASLNPVTQQNAIDKEKQKMQELSDAISAALLKYHALFSEEQHGGIETALERVAESAQRVRDNVDALNAYKEVMSLIAKEGNLKLDKEKLDPEKNINEYKELERQIDETRQRIEDLKTANAGAWNPEQIRNIENEEEKYNDLLDRRRAKMEDLKRLQDNQPKKSRLDNAIVRAIALDQVLLKLYRRIKEMIKVSIEIDAAMTQLRIVTNDSISEVNRYGDTMANVAKEIGASVKDLISSATVFARLGYTLEESVNLSKYSAMLKNVGDIDISAAQDSLTAITKAFNISADDIETVMDKMVIVGNNFPISVSQIAEGMNNAGSSLAAAGNSLEQSIALLTAANTTVQNISKASTGLRTLTARIRRTKVDLDELGESIETSKYDEVIQALSKHNVTLMDINGNYRATYDIMKDIAGIWNQLSNIERAAVAEQLAGTRQQNIFYSLVEQFNEASGAMSAMEDSAGTLQNSYDKYLMSMKAHTDMFSAAVQELSTNIASSSLIKTVVDAGTKLVSILSKITGSLDAIGGVIPVLSGFIALLISSNFKRLFEAKVFHGITESIALIKSARASGKGLFASLFGTAGASAVPISLIVAGLTVIVSLITKIRQKAEEARQAAVQAANDLSSARNKDRASIDEYIDRVASLKERLNDASISNSEMYDVQSQLLNIQDELVEKYGKQAEAINLIGDSAETTAAKLAKLQAQYEKSAAQQFLSEYSGQIAKARRSMEGTKDYGAADLSHLSDSAINNLQRLISGNKNLSALSISQYEDVTTGGNVVTLHINADTKTAQAQLAELQNVLRNTFDSDGKSLLYAYGLNDDLNYLSNQLTEITNKWGQIYDEYIMSTIAATDSYAGVMNQYREAVEMYEDAMSGSKSGAEKTEALVGALEKIDEFRDAIENMPVQPGEEAIRNYFIELLNGLQDEAKKSDARVKIAVDLEDDGTGLKEKIGRILGNYANESGLVVKSDLMARLLETEANAGSMDYFDDRLVEYRELNGLAREYGIELEELIDLMVELGYVADEAAAGETTALTSFEEQANRFRSTAEGELSSVVSEIDKMTSALTQLADMQDAVGEKFKITADQALEFAKVYPEILEGAQMTADGEIQLNEDVVNAFIEGKEAELKSGVDAKIAELEAERQKVLARMQLAQAELDIIEGVKNGELDLTEDQAVEIINIANEVLRKQIEANGESYDAYAEAARAMISDTGTIGQNIASMCTASANNVINASYDAAVTGNRNLSSLNDNIFAVGQTANSTARAVAGIGAGVVNAVAKTAVGIGNAVRAAASKASLTANVGRSNQKYTFTGGSFTPEGYSWTPITLSLDDFAGNLQASIEADTRALAEIDGQLAVMWAIRDKVLEKYKSAKNASSGGSGGSGGGGGSSAVEELEDLYAEEQAAFRDLLNDIEHEIDTRSFFDNESKNIVELYKKAIDEVEKEIAHARELGLSDTDDYIQELQKKWIGYQKSLKDLEDDVRENAKKGLDALADIRVDMLKQEIEDRKDAIDKQLDMLKSFYDKQKDLLQDQYDEEKYLEEQAEKRRQVSRIQQEIDALRNDNSAWAQKRKLELAQELADAQKDLDDFEKDHALETAQDELDALYEMQEKELQDELDLLSEKEKDSKALYDQALEDIKNGSIQLYEEMINWNEKYGDGIEDTIKDAWEEAYKALEEYKTLYNETYEGATLANATGYKPEKGPYDNSSIAGDKSGNTSAGSGSSSSSSSSSSSTPATESRSTAAAPALEVGSAISVKSGTKWYADSYGGGRWGYAKAGKIKYINKNGTHPYNIDGLGWIKKTDIVGYAAGTRSALPGIHSVDERGDEFVFQSSDGNRYRLFSGGEKVLSAGATNFLYDFANHGSEILQKLMNMAGAGSLGNVKPVQNNTQVVMGDIIINGNADKATISEIRRAQRESIDMVLREFNKLNK